MFQSLLQYLVVSAFFITHAAKVLAWSSKINDPQRTGE